MEASRRAYRASRRPRSWRRRAPGGGTARGHGSRCPCAAATTPRPRSRRRALRSPWPLPPPSDHLARCPALQDGESATRSISFRLAARVAGFIWRAAGCIRTERYGRNGIFGFGLASAALLIWQPKLRRAGRPRGTRSPKIQWSFAVARSRLVPERRGTSYCNVVRLLSRRARRKQLSRGRLPKS
jgi:hypothetical protein